MGDSDVDDGTGLAEALLGLDGFRVLDVVEGPDELVVTVESAAELVGCERCGVRAEARDRMRIGERDPQPDPPAGARSALPLDFPAHLRRAAMARMLGVVPAAGGATPDPRWVQLARPRSAFTLLADTLPCGGDGPD